MSFLSGGRTAHINPVALLIHTPPAPPPGISATSPPRKCRFIFGTLHTLPDRAGPPSLPAAQRWTTRLPYSEQQLLCNYLFTFLSPLLDFELFKGKDHAVIFSFKFISLSHA